MQTKTIGIVIIVIGLLMMIYTGFNYITTEKVVDLGVIEINKQNNHPIRWSPVVGLILIVGGVALVGFSKKSSN